MVAAIAYTILALRTLGGFLASYSEKEDRTSYKYYGVKIPFII